MGLAEIMKLNNQLLANQQIADMALQADQAARAARREHRWTDASWYQEEADRLADLIR